MRKWILGLLVLTVWGCTAARIPTYLQDIKPYTQRFYANHEEALAAVQQTLKDMGWQLDETTNPVIYEQDRTSDLDEKQVLLITTIRQTGLFLGTRYAKMNIFIRSKKNISEVEIRYITVTSLPLKTFTTYSNDSSVKRLFSHLEKILPSGS